MNVFFKIMFFVFVFVGTAEPSLAETSAVDPNMPAPESPIKLRIPHSNRTKANLLDAVIDFALTQYFKLFKNATISYDFFEIDTNYDLNFTNFSIKLHQPSLNGTISAPKIKVNFKEFLAFIKGDGLVLPRIEITKPSVDLTLVEKNGETEKKRSLKSAADKIMLEKIYPTVSKRQHYRIVELKVESMSGVKISVTLSNPKEKYAVSQVVMKDVLLPEKIKNLTFSSIEADGKTYTDRAAFLQAIRQQGG